MRSASSYAIGLERGGELFGTSLKQTEWWSWEGAMSYGLLIRVSYHNESRMSIVDFEVTMSGFGIGHWIYGVMKIFPDDGYEGYEDKEELYALIFTIYTLALESCTAILILEKTEESQCLHGHFMIQTPKRVDVCSRILHSLVTPTQVKLNIEKLQRTKYFRNMLHYMVKNPQFVLTSGMKLNHLVAQLCLNGHQKRTNKNKQLIHYLK